jgi:hypothetical protein
MYSDHHRLFFGSDPSRHNYILNTPSGQNGKAPITQVLFSSEPAGQGSRLEKSHNPTAHTHPTAVPTTPIVNPDGR